LRQTAFLLKIMVMGDDGQIGIGCPWSATPIHCSTHNMVICWSECSRGGGGGVTATPEWEVLVVLLVGASIHQ
jgi:hypothetical protein